MSCWRKTAGRLLQPRLASLWSVLVLMSVYALFPLTLTPTARQTGIRPPPPPARPLCRPDMAVNVLPPMPESDSEVVLQLFRYLTEPHPRTCHKVARMGGSMTRGIRREAVMDGHKFICMDPEQMAIPRTERCLVYSLGISNDWSFDDDMEDFGCDVYAFDPSINVSRMVRGERVRFEPLGVGDRDETTAFGWQLLTLDSLMARVGHADSTIHFLKMDVDGGEFAVLGQQAELGRRSALARAQQFGAELHFVPYMPPEKHTAFYREVYGILLAMQEMGFYLFSFEENLVLLDWVQIPGLGRNLTTAMEVVWLRSDCATQAAAQVAAA